jgi:hypothetical protein
MTTLAKAEKMRYNLHANSHGGYGEEVITAGCGPVIEGSIPSSHPTKIRPFRVVFLYDPKRELSSYGLMGSCSIES